MKPEDWRALQPGMGTCFHQALHRWADARATGDIWKVAIGVVGTDEHGRPHRHLHAWLQQGIWVMSAVTGELVDRNIFYLRNDIERRSIALVNPRSIMRARDGVIDKETITALLNASGIAWRRADDGGVLPK